MKKFKDKNIPVVFQRMDETSNVVTDTRFMEVKIWLMHLGENYNGSYFSKDVVEKAIPTLANTPILGFVEAGDNEDLDFSDHRSVLIDKDGERKIVYIGSAYGLIPESNDAKFEFRVGDDGIQREYLTCKGIVWRKNEEATHIFDRDDIKQQSMELHDDFEGEFKDDLFHFTDFKFFGACALGDNVLPAMNSATIEKQFSSKTMHGYIQEKMEEYKSLVNMNKKNQENPNEGGNKMDKEKLIAEFLKQFKDKGESYVSHNDTHVFTVDGNQKLNATAYTTTEETVALSDVSPAKVEYALSEESTEFGLYTKEQVDAVTASVVESTTESLKNEFTKEKEEAVGKVQADLVQATSKFSELETQVKELNDKLAEYTAKERQDAENQVIETFNEVFDAEDEEYKAYKEKISEYDNLEEFSNKLYALAGKRVLEREKEDLANGNVENKFTIKRKKSNPEYVNPLLEKYFGEEQ